MSAALTDARQERGWTQSMLAGAAGVSARTVIRVENGALPSRETADRLSAALGHQPAELFHATSDNGAPTSEARPECRRCGQPLRPGDRGGAHPTRVCVTTLQQRVSELSRMLTDSDSPLA